MLSLSLSLSLCLSLSLSLSLSVSQAMDEDSPPNNLLTYTITSASAFPDYFSILMVEGYAGTLTFRSTTTHLKSFWRSLYPHAVV